MKLYVLIRKDLSTSQQAVQAGHAVAQYLLEHNDWKNETLVYLGVKDEDHLKKWLYMLDKEKIDYSLFKEPDIGNQITAIATCKDKFKKLNCLQYSGNTEDSKS